MPMRSKSHRAPGARTEAERQAWKDANRGSAAKRGYGHRWRQLRDSVLKKEPLCRMCDAEGKVVAANEVDHIIPHKGDQALMFDRSNLQPLCKPCHSRKTATEDSSFAAPYPRGGT
jgi:5-methylcytosine-specific restriction protein A